MRTSLVHPNTAHLPPDEQAKGNYVYTSPEELSRLEALRKAEEQRLEMNSRATVTGRIKASEPNMDQQLPRAGKVVRKRQEPEPVGYDLSELEARLAAVMLAQYPCNVLELLSETDKVTAFNILAEQLGYVVE